MIDTQPRKTCSETCVPWLFLVIWKAVVPFTAIYNYIYSHCLHLSRIAL